MQKVKITRNYNQLKVGEVVEVSTIFADFIVNNSIGVLVECEGDCQEECKDCKPTKKKRSK